jgi:hypothetical protein
MASSLDFQTVFLLVLSTFDLVLVPFAITVVDSAVGSGLSLSFAGGIRRGNNVNLDEDKRLGR